jgi:hypothetical protein
VSHVLASARLCASLAAVCAITGIGAAYLLVLAIIRRATNGAFP